MQSKELIQFITHGREERNLEYKGRVGWSDSNIKSKITKTILAMSNLEYGGIIVVGVEQKNEKFEPNGIEIEMLSTFK
jgi:predicted HTH transcriptional regulator